MTTSASEDSDMTGAYTKKMGMAAYPKSNIQVTLKNHFNSKVYTSSSPVTGDVTITTKRDVRFDNIQILLVGLTKTRVDGVNSPHEVTHTFLKMDMPIDSETTYPVPRVLETGRTYTIPFNFVIPSYLTIGACNHHRLSDTLQNQHVLLPPSMGHWEKDDMAPQMAQVEYSIKARVLRQPDLNSSKKVRVMEATQRIQVLPASPEEAPLNVTKNDKMYNMCKTKSIRKNLLSAKLGKLAAEALQPAAAFLRSDGLSISGTTAQIHLKYDPVAPDAIPPRIGSISGKVFAHTYYSSGTVSTFPNLGDWSRMQYMSTERQGMYSTSVSLPAIPMGQVSQQWTRCVPSSPGVVVRRDSGYSSDNTHAPAESPEKTKGESKIKGDAGAGAGVYYTATLRIPIRLPVDRKTFLPTFHSCITSRFYTVQLSLDVAGASTTITLTLPLQVAVESIQEMNGLGGLPGYSYLEDAAANAEADAYFQPRVIQVPEQQYQQTSELPGYGGHAGR
ncbi:arrestin [Diplogelasinospora grovesii]|uniref:Arrestin n=1 Tax=Diplogelasinospora grovesii TaxID=303347 RepID=A0AAN6NFF8_9PEZI|nr:arrestin [Diplogelasinospora grovesii]